MKKDIKTEEQKRYEQKLYHNTEVLLRKYRDVVWSLEISAIQAQMNFEFEMGSKLDEFLGMSYAAGADLTGTDIQEQIRTLERNKKMLRIIETAVDAIKKSVNNGEIYYWTLYYTYMSEKREKTIEDIMVKISEKTGEYMSWKTYYRKRRQATELLSTILWGFTSKECLPILEDFT